jgi:hemerythrin
MVNAVSTPVFEEIDAEHRELDRLYSQIRVSLNDCFARPYVIRKWLMELATKLSCHFAREEEGGYFDEIVELAPRLSFAAEALQREHGELLDSLDRLHKRLSTASSNLRQLDSIRQDFEKFLHKCDQHESRESALVQEAHLSDIGIGD